MDQPAAQPILQIVDEDELYRRLHKSRIRRNGTVSSAAFMVSQVPESTISVDLARLTTPEESRARGERQGFGLGGLLARDARAMDFQVTHDPVEGNPAHTLIEGENSREKCYRLAEATRILIMPD